MPSLFAASVAVLAALMLHTETTIPMPDGAGETVVLEGLIYKARFEARVSSVRLLVRSAPGADPVLAEWTFTGSNSDGQMHRVSVEVRLMDENGKPLGVFEGKRPLPPGAREETFPLKTTVKAADWKAARKVRIWANWIT